MSVFAVARTHASVAAGFLAVCVAVGMLTATNHVLALMLLVVAFIAAVVLSRPDTAGVIALTVVPVASGIRAVTGTLPPAELLVGLLTMLLVAVPRRPQPWDRLDTVLFAFVAAGVGLGAFDMIVRHGGGDLQTLLGPVQFFLMFRLARVTLTSDRVRRLALRGLLFASIPASTLTIAQGIRFPGAEAVIRSLTGGDILDSWGYRHHLRATGPFPIWHALAGYLMLVLLVCVALLALRTQKVMNPVAVGAIAFLGVIALVLSQTFTTLIALMVASFIVSWRLRAMRALATFAVIGAIVALLFGSVLADRLDRQYAQQPTTSTGVVVPQTIGYRFMVWTEQYLPNMGPYWLTGYGPGIPDAIVWQHTESSYITLWLHGGLPLLLLHCWLMVVLYKRTRDVARRLVDVDGAIALVVSTTVMMLWVMNFIWPYSIDSGLVQPFWLLAGMAVAPLASDGRVREARPSLTQSIGA